VGRITGTPGDEKRQKLPVNVSADLCEAVQLFLMLLSDLVTAVVQLNN